jgi:hypothetical protein
MTRAVRSSSEPPGGEDSLLDVIANLVGVLIILVAIASAASRQHMQRQASRGEDPHAGLDRMREAYARISGQAEQSGLAIRELEHQTALAEAATRKLENLRHQLLIGREVALRELQRRADESGVANGAAAAVRAQVTSLRAELTRLNENRSAKQAAQPELRELVHYPTPIARTVFSDEIHFRIRAGRVDFLPISELMDLMKTRLRSAEPGTIAENLNGEAGPLEGYRLRYELQANPAGAPGANGPTGLMVELLRFELDPLVGHAGEPVDTAMDNGSRFWTRLQRLRPERTTVSLWVYPDSYAEFARLRDQLRERGFQTAAWPLLENQRVSGGRDGLRTSAQ